MKTLIKGRIVPVNDALPAEFDGYVSVIDNLIDYVGTERPSGSFDTELDFSDMVVMPGLVNTHTHASMTLLRGVADDLNLQDWLNKEIFPREAKMTPDDIYWGAKLAIAEFLLGGTTCFADMYFTDRVAHAVTESGIRANISLGMTIFGGQDGLKNGVEFANKWQNAENGRIHTCLGPHAIYTCPVDFMKDIVKAAKDNSLGIHMHISETKKENDDCATCNGASPVKVLGDLGAFDVPTIAAHCVCLSDEDMDILKAKNVSPALNIGSNFKLGSGIARIADMIDKGLNVTIGTDGPASNNDLDMWEEMRWVSMSAKVWGEPLKVPAAQALKLATSNGAKALGWNNLGSLAKGNLADLIVVDFSNPRLVPVFSHVSHLVYAVKPSDIKHVMVDGNFAVWDREIQTFDVAETISKVKEIARRLA
ncbi:MAG: amidohydrolase [Caldisericia bacterium]|nr:amidohydrolase [Caldisericia bacterium]